MAFNNVCRGVNTVCSSQSITVLCSGSIEEKDTG